MIRLHDHPTKEAYVSDDEFPLIDFQGHWQPANPQGELGHLHFGLKAPIYGEIGAPLRVPFKVQMFKLAGELLKKPGGYIASTALTHVLWNDTNSDVPPRIAGDPNGLVVMEGTLTIDPATFVDHGWDRIIAVLEVRFDSGDSLRIFCVLPVFSVKNPAAEETRRQGMGFGERLMLGINTGARSVRSISGFGNNWMQVRDYLPVGPFADAWSTRLEGGVYGTKTVPVPGVTEYRRNPALHSHNPGDLLGSIEAVLPKNKAFLSTFIDPLDYGEGRHVAMFKWIQRTAEGNEFFAPNEELDSLITFPLEVGDVPAPPASPCEVDPLVVTNVVWPSVAANHPVQSIMATETKMDIVDARGCRVTIDRDALPS